jgi:thiosulfate/3-mercaptopyruvate sulfurtransferase
MKLIISLLLSSLYLLANDAFINAEQLKTKLQNKNLVILDTSDLQTFNMGHIPNARRADISLFRHWMQNHTYLLINSPQKIESAARSLGINNNSEVVIYGHHKNKELLKASYIALTLIANGFTNVSIFNGGYNEWKDEYEDDKGLISTKTPNIKSGNFRANFNPNILVDMTYVKNHIGKTPMIEARPKVYFTGEKKSNGVKRLGHITKAQSSFWRDKFESDDTLKTDKELNEIFIKSQKLNPQEEVIAYCTGGLEASMNWYILSQYLHFKDVKIYDASMKQWGNLEDTPMER